MIIFIKRERALLLLILTLAHFLKKIKSSKMESLPINAATKSYNLKQLSFQNF